MYFIFLTSNQHVTPSTCTNRTINKKIKAAFKCRCTFIMHKYYVKKSENSKSWPRIEVGALDRIEQYFFSEFGYVK